MDERYKRLSSHFQTRSKIKTENEVCRSIVIKSQPDEHVVEEIEVGPGSHSSSPVSDFPNGDSPVGEIIVKDEYLDFDFDDGSSSNKWSHKNVLRFLESFNQVLNTEERNGGFLSRKNLFARVTALMNDKGISFTQTETEKKYNNMLMTYRRCQQKLLRLRKTPSWPYFKLFADIRTRDIRLHNLSAADIPSSPRHKRSRVEGPPSPSLHDELPLPPEPSIAKNFESKEKELSGGWRKRRLEQDKSKMRLVEDLLRISESSAETDDITRQKLRDAENDESASLVSIQQEIRATKETITQGVRAVTKAIQDLNKIILAKKTS